MDGGGGFLDLDSTLVGEDQCLEPPGSSSDEQLQPGAGASCDDESRHGCALCRRGVTRPRLLRCLHTFCEQCLQRRYEESEDESGAVVCPRCERPTPLDERGASALPLDWVTQNMRDMELVLSGAAQCANCRTVPAALRCADCAMFLCNACQPMHQMNSYQKHKVVSFDELKQDFDKNPVPIHRPVTCHRHSDLQIHYFCQTCMTVSCEQCQSSGMHPPPEHIVKRICDIEQEEWSGFLSAVEDAKTRVKKMDASGNSVQPALTRLKTAHEQARRAIEAQAEQLQRAVDECVQRARQQCEQLHDSKRDQVWSLGEQCHKGRQQLQTAVRLADRLLEFANSAELVTLKPLVLARIADCSQLPQLPDTLDMKYVVCQAPERLQQTVAALMGYFQEDAAAAASAVAVIAPAASAAAQPGRSAAHVRSQLSGGSSSSGVYSRQASAVSPVEADMPPMVATGGSMFSSPGLPSPLGSSVLAVGSGSGSSGLGSAASSQSSAVGQTNGIAASSTAAALTLGLSPPLQHQLQHHAAVSSAAAQLQYSQHQQHDYSRIISSMQQQQQQHEFTRAMALPQQPQQQHYQNDFARAVSQQQQRQHELQRQVSQQHEPQRQLAQQQQQYAAYQRQMSRADAQQRPPSALSTTQPPLYDRSVGYRDNGMMGADSGLYGGGGGDTMVAPPVSSAHGSGGNMQLDFLNNPGTQMALQNIKALATLSGLSDSGAGDVVPSAALAAAVAAAGQMPSAAAVAAALAPGGVLGPGDAAALARSMQQLRCNVTPSPTALSALHPSTSPLSGANGCYPSAGSTLSGSGSISPVPRSGSAASAMQIRQKFGQLGQARGQFNSPHGFCLGVDEEVVVADTNNHRIQVFDKNGEHKFMFGVPGKDEGQLWYPRKVAVIRPSGKYVICDRGSERSRMQLFSRSGYFIRKISIRCIDIVAGLAISSSGHIVVVDSVTPTVFLLAENGDLLNWFDCSDYMREPSDIAVVANEYYICDFKNHCVVVFDAEGRYQRRLGSENITNFPNGIDVSDAGDVLIGDSHGNKFHVTVFNRAGQILSEFECPQVKVSRCCGLKLTSEGYIITIAKNNHHVLILNTLYIA